MLLMSFIFVKHFELPCVERCYVNKLALPCLTCGTFCTKVKAPWRDRLFVIVFKNNHNEWFLVTLAVWILVWLYQWHFNGPDWNNLTSFGCHACWITHNKTERAVITHTISCQASVNPSGYKRLTKQSMHLRKHLLLFHHCASVFLQLSVSPFIQTSLWLSVWLSSPLAMSNFI